MKRVISLLTVAAMLCTLFAGLPVFGAGTVVDNGRLVFSADFDNTVPTKIDKWTEVDAVITAGNDGNAASMAWDDVDYGGVTYAVDSFDMTTNTLFKFDLLNSGAGNNAFVGLYDSNGSDISVRFKPANVTSGTWYTYIIKQTSTSNTYEAWRKAVGATAWEAVSVEFARKLSTVTSTAFNNDELVNAFRFAWGSSSSGAGSWLIDNVEVYSGIPAAKVDVPDDVSKTKSIYIANDGFDGASNMFSEGSASDATVKATMSVKTIGEGDTADNVLDIDLSSVTTFGSYWSTYFKSKALTYPSTALDYTVSFDFRRLNDNFTDEALGFVVGTGAGNNRVAKTIPVSQFDKNEWYNIKIVTYESSVGNTGIRSIQATKLSDGTTTALTTGNGNLWSSSLAGLFTLYPTVNSGSTMLSSTDRAKAHYQFDDVKISYEASELIETEAFTTATSGTVHPMLAAYDENGVLTKVIEANEATIEAIGTYGGYASADYDVFAYCDEFINAESVKALFWDGYENAKAYAPYAEIGDDISETVVASEITPRSFEVTSDMIPSGGTGNYTLFAYKVPFPVDNTTIPDYDATEHTILAIEQSETAITSFNFDSSLYNGEEEDIVIICNADGAAAPVVTLYEENDAPSFTNISMLLGADESERNFTWYSLDGSRGKLTYQKKTQMVDGEFTDSATVVEATRTHDDSVYSTKEYYYNNQAVMTGLEPDTEYVYQLSNGDSKSPMYTIKIADDDSTFSFAFGGDPQLGGLDGGNYADETENFGRTIHQMLTAPEFEGVEFFVSAGDQIESASTIKDIEAQYDIFLNHDEWATFPMAATLGNHDAKPAGTHMQHFNEPNRIINPETGEYYGASPSEDSASMDGTDYYYVYNSVLFMHINLNTFDDLSGNIANEKTPAACAAAIEANRVNDKADAEEHAEFINKVLEETADNKDILWKVVVCHQSPFGGSYHGDYTKKTSAYSGETVYSRSEQYDYINIREYLLPYFYEAGVDLVLSGHDHTYTRTHILKPNENDDILGDEVNSMVITPYTDGNYVYADGTTTPTYDNGADGNGWVDKNGKAWKDLKVKSKPVKVTDPDGFLWVTGSSSSGSQVNGAENPNHYAAVCEFIRQRSLVRFDVSPTSLKLSTYNLGTRLVEDSPLTLVDEFEIVKTADVAVQGVSLPESVTIAAGQAKELTAKLSPAQPTNANVTWTSDNEAVAKVENGVVTAITTGSANITVTTADGGYTATCAVTVVDSVPVTSISLAATAEVEVFTTKTLSATVAPENATTPKLKWTSSDESVATVDENGNVTALKPGSAVITAAATDGSGVSASCTVTPIYVASTSLTIDKAQAVISVMEEMPLSVAIMPANATYKDVVWTSNNEAVATVDENGVVVGKDLGTAIITGTTGEGKTVTCNLEVTGGVNLFEDFEDDTMVLNPPTNSTAWKKVQEADGNWVYEFDGSAVSSISGTAYALDSGEYNAPMALSGYTYSFDYCKLSDEGFPAITFRTFNENGVYGGKRIGVSIFEKDVWYNVKLTYDADADVKWSGYYKKFTDAEYTAFAANDLGYDETSSGTSGVYPNRVYITPGVKYSSADLNSGSDSSNATRVANAKKTAFKIDNIKLSTAVAATGMTLAESSATLEVGETATISPVFAPSNATDTVMTYSSSNPEVATVDRYGKVTAIGGGTATITVTAADGGYTATYAVKVNAIIPEITVVKDGTKFTVTTNATVDGEKVYVAAYDANDRVIAATMADYAADGTTLTLSADGATYYKTFIWGTNSAPVIVEKQFN